MSHQIEVPPKLFADWLVEGRRQHPEPALIAGFVARKAAEWAADQTLHSACAWLICHSGHPSLASKLLVAMRPKPPSLKQQALDELEEATQTIRRALESIPDEQ